MSEACKFNNNKNISEERQAMKKWQKISLIVFHGLMLTLTVCILCMGYQLRWRVGYIIFWLAILSGISLFFIHFKNLVWNVVIKIYASCWISIAVLGGVITYLIYDPVYCESGKYIMKGPDSIIGFDSAILYEKRGFLEIERQRFIGVYPDSIVPIDSIGAIIIYGDFSNGEKLEKDISIFPIDDSFNDEKVIEYAQQHNIKYRY